ncbi:nuclear pore complex protein Nup153 isoform X2 [Rhinatrema bivittatum]|uniref:nuclear pore complex protein Nup153 isoform X2 n=1 Tax=Rhinatrema bivittatum TaxID=194408 RepID=UPI00112B9560|nr:nuclear pore complex protein Nup153 isoform X2 [Rhinatrema bivittatum]
MAAAAGGGKIRTRRYHIASKPYAKNKQGLISRVTDTVKSIVPGWLQKYFNKSEDGCVEVRETRGAAEENREDDLRHAHTADGEPAPLHDGRVTPEAVPDYVAEPSTSRSALNYPDVLTRPSLHRTHLNFAMSDPPALHCQPSTSSAFPIGSSGFSLVKEIKDSASQHDDDNISTTSGFSSRASDKDVAVSKNVSGPSLWSPEVDRSHSFSQHNVTSCRKPAFNPSAFVTLSPSLGNASILKTSQLGDSPFYPGKTTYGGAAATRQSKIRGTPYQAPLRRQVKAKQVSTQTYGVTSSTARRILQSLEKMSSPLADAKRIPSVGSSPLSRTPEQCNLDTTDFQAKKRKVDAQYPPVQKLMTPKVLTVSSNRSMYIKPSLMPGAQPSKSGRRTEGKRRELREKDRAPEVQLEMPESFSYPKFSTPATNGLSSGGGKMRRERGTHYVAKGDLEDEEVSVPDLPKISLPISTSALPNFSFSLSPSPLPSATASLSSSVAQPVVNKVQLSTSSSSSPVFTFSSPIVKSTKADVLPFGQAKGFTFSAPAVKSSSASTSGSKVAPVTSSFPAKETVTMNNTSSKEEVHEAFEGPFRPARSLKEGSVLDILKNPDFMSSKATSHTAEQPVLASTSSVKLAANNNFSASGVGFGEHLKPAPGQWQCSTCLVQNKATDSKCAACQKARVPPADAAKQAESMDQGSTVKPALPAEGLGFGDRLKPAAGTWECDTCLVQNKAKITKCVACETPKSGTGVKSSRMPPAVTSSATIPSCASSSTSFAQNEATLGFGDKFQKPPGAWNCSVCLLQNKIEDSKCVACFSEKPGGSTPVATAASVPAPSAGQLGFGDKFKRPVGSWQCDTCLVENKSDALKCASCESSKPGTKTELKGFGSSSATTPAFKFGLQSATADSPQTVESQSGFKCQEQGNFKFGVSSSEPESSKSTSAGAFSFSKSAGGFKFGAISSSDSKLEENKKDNSLAASSSGFSFGLPASSSKLMPSVPSSVTFKFGTSETGQQAEKKEGKSASGFSFGTGSSASSEGTTSGAGGFQSSIGLKKQDAPAPASFSFTKAEKKDEAPAVGWGSETAFGKPEPGKEKASVSAFGTMQAEGKQDPFSTPASSLFGKKSESAEPKPLFPFGKAEQTKEESAMKSSFNFSLAKSTESKETESTAKSVFPFGTSTDQGASKPAFNFLSSGSSATAVASTAPGTGSVFGSSSSASNSATGGFIFGKHGSTTSSSTFNSTTEPSAPQAFNFTPAESKPPVAASASSGTGSVAAPFVFGVGSGSSSNFSFGAAATTTTASSTGTPFMFGSGSPAVGPRFGASQTPSFGQGQGSGQASVPAFGSISSSASSFFPASSQPAPTFGTLTSGSQPPAFGQQVSQAPAFGSSTAPPAAGGGFQFGGNTNFNFSSGSPASGVFTFGVNAGGAGAAAATAVQPPASSAFPFNQPQSFTVGSNGKNMFSASGTSVSNRKIKTAIRRRK